MSGSSPEPHDPLSPVSNEADPEPLTGKHEAEQETDLLLQIYAAFGIEYDPLTGEFHVRA